MPILKAAAKARVAKRRDVAARHQLARRKNRVAIVERGDDEVMGVGCKQQRYAEDGEKISDQYALLALGRIHRGDKAEAKLLGDHRACDLQRRKRHPRGGAEHDTDDDLVDHQYQ
jgi:hypothetical protein